MASKPLNRIVSLDILRGIAILTMVLSGVLPRRILPTWMYHAQVPPPDHVFIPTLPGITWVDLVFPFFLFCMGAAFPLALRPRLEKGDTVWLIARRIVIRGFTLGVFAIWLQHLRPHHIQNPPAAWTWLLAISGLLVLFLVYSRYPPPLLRKHEKWIRAGGWLMLATWIPLYGLISGEGFSLNRSDIILLVLTNMAIFAALIWLATRDRPLWRLGILGLYLALRLAHDQHAGFQAFWSYSPLPWFFRWDFLKYLFIVLPGTFIGEALLTHSQETRVRHPGAIPLTVLALLIMVTSLLGYQARWTGTTTLILIGLTLISLVMACRNEDPLIRKLLNWGAYWVILGAVLEPFEGGIKKDPSTLSYYFLTTGIATYLITALECWRGRVGMGWFGRLLADNGRNPMLAYVGMANLIWPIMALTGLERLLAGLNAQPIPGLMIALAKTLILAILVQWVTRRGWLWKT